MANALASIEKLGVENYTTWCIQLKSLLITLDLWSAVVDKCPEEEPGKTIWIVCDRKALATITLSVKPSELIHIKNCITAKSAWDTLNALYKADTACRKVNLFKKLIRFQFRSSEKFSAQLKEFCCIVDDLKEVGISMEDDFLSILLLCSLPDEMENFVVAIESRDALPKLDNLVAKILEEEQRHGDKCSSAETAFSANESKRRVGIFRSKNISSSRGVRSEIGVGSGRGAGRGAGSGNSSRTRQKENGRANESTTSSRYNNNIKCFKCGRRGHIRSQCTFQSNNSLVDDNAWSLVEKEENLNETWIIDSGATSHMCKDAKLFSSLVCVKHRIVLASGACVYARGKGTVNLKTKYTTVNLRDVWYVPDLHSNFFSIVKAAESGNVITFTENNAIMQNKNKKTILTGALENGIYVANVLVSKSADCVNGVSDDASDWHKRFGHINTNDLNKLSKMNMVNGLNFKISKKH